MDAIRHNSIIILLFLYATLTLTDQIISNIDPVIPGQYYEPVYDKSFLSKLNEIKTLESIHGIGSIRLDEIDIAMLSKDCYGHEGCLSLKSDSLRKYRTKMEAVQCVGGAIVQHMLPDLTGIVLRKKLYGFGGPDSFHGPRKLVARLLSILKYGKIVAHKWLWIAYTRILAADNWPRYRHVIGRDHFDDQQLDDQLLEYLGACQRQRYLPSTMNQLSTWYAEKCAGFETECLTRQFYSFDDGVVGRYLQEIRDGVNAFQASYLALTHVTVRREASVFGQPDGLDVDWDETKAKLVRAKTQLNFRKHTYAWTLNPFVYLEYHGLIVKIVEFKVHAYVWLHLYTLSNNVANRKMTSNVYRANVKRFYSSFYEPLKDAVRHVGVGDWFLWDLVTRLGPGGTPFHDYLEGGFLRSDLATVELKMFSYLQALDVDENSFRKALENALTTYTVFDPVTVDRHVTKIKTYLNGLDLTLSPVDYGLITFFCSGNASIEQTFYSHG